MSRLASRFLVATLATLMALSWVTLRPQPVLAVSPHIVISQVYGGGGNTGATYTHDFVELFNRGATSQSLNGWSVQYTSAQGTGLFGSSTTLITELPNVTLAPGQYYLIQEGAGAGNGVALPTADLVDGTAIAMGAGGGKVALVDQATGLGCNGGSTPCTTEQLGHIIDLIGYGGTSGTTAPNFFEGTAGPLLTNSTSASRGSAGCTDTDTNGSDFTAGTPSARNTATTLNPCGGGVTLSINDVSQNEGNSGTGAFLFTISLSGPAPAGGVTFDVTTANGTATAGVTGDYVAVNQIGVEFAAGETTMQYGIGVHGDTTFEGNETFFVNISNASGATIADGQGLGTILNDDAGNSCGDPYTPIHTIQGAGAAVPTPGTYSTEGIVVGDFETSSGLQTFYIQEPAADANSSTSQGIQVFTGPTTNAVNVGDRVRVTGFARERFNQSTIMGANDTTTPVPAAAIEICSTGVALPAATAVSLPVTATSDFEKFEGMRIVFPQDLVIAEYFNYDQFGEIVLALPLPGEPRPFSGTALDEPGAAANARTNLNSRSRITLDDNVGGSNPSVLRHPNGAPFSTSNLFRGGDHVQNAIGVMGFDFSLYRILPTGPADYTATNPRPLAPEPVGGSLRVSAMNTLNFFITADYPTGNPLDNKCGHLNTLECRGWDFIEPLEFDRQRDKLIQALLGINADVLGLNELENSRGVDALTDPNGIVAGLNAELGAGTYEAIETGTIGTDAIRVGLIYKPAAVTPIGSFEILTSAVDSRFIDTRSRPALAQTFEENATGARFTVVVNHLKSKGSACADIGDPDAGDGQGNCNLTRKAAAQAIVDWLATDPTDSNDPDFLIIGDLNSYAMEDPIDAIKAGPDDTVGTGDDYTNLIAHFGGPFAYSYTFDGQAGYLDHALASDSLFGQVTGATDWHINSDEPDAVDYDTSFKPPAQEALWQENAFRTSDHDPVIVGLDLINVAPSIAVSAGLSCTTSSSGGTFELTVGDPEQGSGALGLSLTGNTDTTLVPNANVTFGGSGSSRTVSITAAPGASGAATLTLGVSDGWSTTTVTIAVRVGTEADETFAGTNGADLIIGGQGHDILSGLGGADVLCGGIGDDTASGGTGSDALNGDKGDDILAGGDDDDLLVGGQGGDSLSGNAGDDTLTGNQGPDAFSGGPGNDTATDLTPSQGDTTDGT